MPGDIQAHFEESYGVEVSAPFISQVTHAVMDEVKVQQNRSLDSVYPMVYLDALVVHSRASGAVQNQSVCLALGIHRDGEQEILERWKTEAEGARFWLSVMTELKHRGLQDIFIACTDGLKAFLKQLRWYIPIPRHSGVSFIKCATHCVM